MRDGGQSTRRRRCAGGSLAEFALVISVALTALFAVMEMGQAMSAYHFVASAAREASRYAIVRGSECTSFSSACPANAGDITTYVTSITPSGMDASSETVTTTWSPDDSPGSTVTVTVQYSFAINLPLLPAISLPLSSTAEMVISQ